MGFVATRKATIEKMLREGTWAARWEKCVSLRDFSDVLEAYCKEKGLVIVRVKPKRN